MSLSSNRPQVGGGRRAFGEPLARDHDGDPGWVDDYQSGRDPPAELLERNEVDRITEELYVSLGGREHQFGLVLDVERGTLEYVGVAVAEELVHLVAQLA